MDPREIEAVRRLVRKHRARDYAFAGVGLFCLVLGLSTLIVLVLDLAVDGLPRINWDFFGSFPSRRPESAGILSAWVGTVLVMIVTLVTAVLLGVAAGIYLEEFAPKNWFTWFIEINVTNLAGVPSIVYGLLALGVFVYALDLGESILTAGLTLALLILPVIIVSTREAIRAVPQNIREGAFAVGASDWRVAVDHVLPCSVGGILTGVILGMARAIGETAPIITIGALTFIAFLPPSPLTPDFPWLSFDWLRAPFTVMPIQMFNWVSRPQEAFHINAAAAGTVLLVMTILMNALAITIRYRFRKRIVW